MFTVHVPQRFAQISRSFAKTDGGAWIMILIAVGTFGLVAAYLFG